MGEGLYRKRKIDAIGREQTPPNITPDGVWQYAHDPQATRDAALGAKVRKAAQEGLAKLEGKETDMPADIAAYMRRLSVFYGSTTLAAIADQLEEESGEG